MKIVALGNVGTYCDIAAKKYAAENHLDFDIVYAPSIVEMFKELKNCDLGVFPFENCLSGFVVDSLCGIVDNHCSIISQVQLDVDFAFVSNANDIKDVKNIYSQFKVYGQCQKFISENGFLTISTQSNTETLEKIGSAPQNFGAIIPMHLLEENKFHIVKKHVADNLQNKTRFFVVENQNTANVDFPICSFVLEPNDIANFDIVDILQKIKLLDVNVFSVVSMPNKTRLMQYKYFVECDLKNNAFEKLESIKDTIKNDCQIQVLGTYNKL